METLIPPFENTRKKLLDSGKTDEWIKENLDRIDAAYSGSIKDPAFKAWLLAREVGVEVDEIKATSSVSEGQPIQLGDLTKEKARHEYELDQKERTKFKVEGVVANVQYGTTQKGKDKVDFVLVDSTGRVKMACYGDAAGLFTEARVKDLDYVEIPMSTIFGGYVREDDEDSFWFKLTVPPFGEIRKVSKDIREVLKNPEKDAVDAGDPILVDGVITALQHTDHDACSVCGRWIMDGKEEDHDPCGEYETEQQRSWEGTIVTGSGQFYRIRFNHRTPLPKIAVAKDMVRIIGFWTDKNAVAVAQCVVLSKKGSDTSTATSAPAAPKKTPAAAPKKTSEKKAPAKPKPAPKPAEPAAEEEEEAEEAPADSASPPAPKAEAAPAVPAAPASGNGAIPPEVVALFERLTTTFQGENRVAILVNNSVERGVIPDDPAWAGLPGIEKVAKKRERAQEYVDKAVEGGLLSFTDDTKKIVKWMG